MKVLFIGEGPHDIGRPSPNPFQPRSAQGTIPVLARRVCAEIDAESIALAWAELPRFHAPARKHGYASKVAAAALLADRKYGCAGTVVVADRDGRADRGSELATGAQHARQLFPANFIVVGLAVESAEAWILGAPEKIAEELGVDVQLVRDQYPKGIDVERLLESSGKPEHRPKALLQRLAQIKHRDDSVEFRQAVAERTDPAALAQVCQQGFAPFAQQLRAVFAQGA